MDMFSVFLIGITVFALYILSRFRVIRQNERGIIEKGGKFKALSMPGVVFIDPLEKLYIVKTTGSVQIENYPVITKDNVTCKVDVNIYYKLSDVKEAIKKLFYEDYKNAIEDHIKSELFEIFSTYSLKQISSSKLKIIAEVRNNSINLSNHYTITNMEIKKITLPEDIQKGIEKSKVKEMDAYVTNAEGIFQTNTQSFSVKFKETTISGPDKFYTFAYSNGMDDFDNQLSKFDDSIDSFKILSEPTTNNEGGGCLIATATFGSELAPQVQQLRELRDNTLLPTKTGSAFMSGFNQFYYLFSPSIADYERENPIFKETVKLAITPILTSLSILNHVNINSEQEVLGYGISIILLNIGMYFIAPAMLIYKIRK